MRRRVVPIFNIRCLACEKRLLSTHRPSFTISQTSGVGLRKQYTKYIPNDTGRFVPHKIASTAQELSLQEKLTQELLPGLVSKVLPHGYPDSVPPSYQHYMRWQFLSMVASSASGVMSTQALLHAVGLGSGAIPIAAALNWVIKDGVGQLGGVLFSSVVSTKFDANPKLWRMVAALSLDASVVLELLTPLAPGYFLPLAALANTGKNVSFLAASASKAAIHSTFAIQRNLADITAKAGSQSILSSTIGLAVGIWISSLVGSEYALIVPAAIALSGIHLAAAYRSVLKVVLPTIALEQGVTAHHPLDSQRLELIMSAYLEGEETEGFESGRVMTPEQASKQETIFMYRFRELTGTLTKDAAPRVVIGASLDQAVQDTQELETLMQGQGSALRYGHQPGYLLVVRGDESTKRAAVLLMLIKECSNDEMLAGAHHGWLASQLLARQGYKRHAPSATATLMHQRALPQQQPYGSLMPEITSEASDRMCESERDFASQLRARGWATEVLFLEEGKKTRIEIKDHC